MRLKILAGLWGLAIIALPVFSATASEGVVIAVPGSATKVVTTDELSISFDVSTESASFSGAKSEADTLVASVKDELEHDYPGRVHVSSQINVLKQKKISWSSKAKKLDHRVTVTIGGFQKDLPDQAVRVLDKLLALDPRLELTDMEGRLSEDKTAQVRAELLTAALQDAYRRASALAEEAGQRISAPRVINAAPGYSVSRYGNQFVDEFVTTYASSFYVTTELVGEAQMSMELVAEYVTTPM